MLARGDWKDCTLHLLWFLGNLKREKDGGTGGCVYKRRYSFQAGGQEGRCAHMDLM